MVAHLVRLKLSLLRNGLKRGVWQVVGLVLAAVYGLGVLALAVTSVVVLAVTADLELRRTALVLLGTVLVAGWWIVPLLAFGLDATLQIDRFVTFALRRRDLAVGLFLASLVGVPGLVTVLGALASGLVWAREGPAVLVGVVGGAVGAATAVLGARVLTTLLGPALGNRRARDLIAIVAIVPLMLLGPILTGVGQGLAALQDRLPRIADVAAWTPLGAPWALGADAAAGDWGALGLRLLLVLGVLGLLVLAWDRALAASLVRRPGASSSARPASGLGLLGRVPASPTWAVAARCLTYWRRDPRYSGSVVVVPLLPVLFAFLGNDGLLLAAGPVAAYLMGWAISADVAYDHTAFWTHLAAPVRGVQDRLGRVVAAAALGLPAAVVITVVGLAITGRWELALPLLALDAGVLATALGLASVASAQLVVPVPKPGESPFASPQGGSSALLLSQLAGTAALLVLAAPGVVLTLLAASTGSAGLGWAAAATSLVVGAIALAVGVQQGGVLYDRRAPYLMERLVAMA
nr:hypothetical protein [uncultured Actinotalea sp.]